MAVLASIVANLRIDLMHYECYIAGVEPRMQLAVRDLKLNAICARLEALASTGITPQQASELSSSVGSPPWVQDDARRIMALIDQVTIGASPKKRRDYQYCAQFVNYMTKQEWIALKGPAMRSAKVAQLAGRAWAIGLVVPAEKTSFAIAEILCWCHQVEGAEEQRSVYNDIKAAIKELASRRTHPCEPLLEYPIRPAELPEVMYAFAYGTGEGPVDCSDCITGVCC